jgi:AraC-like DNA-binding protein
MQKEQIYLQSLTENKNIAVGYSDDDIVIVDSIQKYTETNAAHVAMNTIVVCLNGRVQGLMNGRQLELHKNQVAIIPPNVTVTDLMISPDFDMKGMFFTNRILQSYLHDKIRVWNEMMYVYRIHVLTLDEDGLQFYVHFYEMLRLCINNGAANPYQTEVVQALLRSGILAVCGSLLTLAPANQVRSDVRSATVHFQRFLDLLGNTVKKHRTVESYANELCISAKYLSAICKDCSGKTANEWITEHVMEDIRYYLKSTNMSMKQICIQLGFPNTSFFGKYVKEHFGITPLKFRRR